MRDIREILAWTRRVFGATQAETYRKIIRETLRELERGPDQPGVRKRNDIISGLLTLHVARHGRRGRHFVMFRIEGDTIEILRLLHDSMDIAKHVSDGDTPDSDEM